MLKISGAIDALTERLGRSLIWLILAAVIISAGNAIVRKVFNWSSNALLEIQWYLFSAVFMLGAGYALLKNVHVRIDFLSNRLSPRIRNFIDIVGIVAIIFPLCALIITLSWQLFSGAWHSGEMSQNAGGLVRWPVMLLLPAGFALLALQSFSELLKRIAFVTGAGPDTISHADNESNNELMHEIEQFVAHEPAHGQPSSDHREER